MATQPSLEAVQHQNADFSPAPAAPWLNTSNQVQAGLEVVPPQYWAQNPQHIVGIAQYQKPEAPQSSATPVPSTNPPPVLRPRRRIPLIVLIVLPATLILLAIIGIVLGVVLGTRAKGNKSTSTPPSVIRTDSALAATGWRNGLDFSIRLFYQGKDGFLRMSAFDSTSANWTALPPVVQAKDGTPLAASSFYYSYFFNTPANPYFQTELFYLDNSNQIREWNWQQSIYGGSNGSLSSYTFKAGESSRMVSYWPSIVFQDDLGNLQEILYNLSIPGNQAGWSQRSLGALGYNYSGLAEVPVTFIDTSLSTLDSYGVDVLYQQSDSKMYDASKNTNVGAWSTNAIGVSIPASASIGSFSVPRSANTGGDMNVYVLWQNASGQIQMVWQDDTSGTGWNGPSTSDAFNGADTGTSIACLTPSAWPPSELQANYDLSRCYFQSNGTIKETKFDGSAWTVVGDVPQSSS